MQHDPTQWLGWAASAVLCLTLAAQLRAQWRAQSSEGVSPGLYIGQMTASAAFTVYSYLVDNWVFVVTNALLLVAAAAGLVLWRRFARQDSRAGHGAEAGDEPAEGGRALDEPPSSTEASFGGRRWTLTEIRRRLTTHGGVASGRWG